MTYGGCVYGRSMITRDILHKNRNINPPAVTTLSDVLNTVLPSLKTPVGKVLKTR
ncbi:hypothetical protein ANAPC1_01463 [Anaplasma phagocytophilum]|uniref:Uncharacterized protein n=1 Tax=Anaplasma phagocytophilum TaxID=948 RepID=A0AA45ZI51_ANAPH|nr:hypothetical protein ANAPC1_01463 [Anaplasma phagocytophilum]SBO30656.1 hypothetical protein ANAPC2_00340 [Anaplasma phagocytophilum]SBO30932.1 hypothetical protein ANAPC3_00352 [Anaplasma phagocytophilum]SBO30994.1 hypothetical protein ANAPC4_00354 [Anaplasma phagocytophilum]SCV62345.1 hypothetical protein ANAPC5_00225 [Anaplasma phagocytophilum]